MSQSTMLPNIDHIPGTAGKNEILIKCPYCKDHKYRLGINLSKGVYHCFNCDKAGRITDIKEFALISFETPSNDFEALKSKLRGMCEISSKDFDLDHISWPLDKKGTPLAYKYMIDRGFTPEEIVKYNLRVGKPYFDASGKEIKRTSGRIIFPFMSDGNCVYYIARTLTGAIPKYLNSDGSKSTLVYNIDKVDGVCILCEGIISAIAAERTTGIPSVAVLGKSISFFQLNRIRSKCNKIYLSMDGDVTEEENSKILKRLVKMFDEVYLVKLPYGTDPDELKSEYQKYFQEAQKINILF